LKALYGLLALCVCAGAQTSDPWFDRLAGPYRAPRVPPVSFHNSPRIDSLIRAGNLYLSLPDAIALALENNLDIEFERFWPRIASTDVLRAKGGGTLRGIYLLVNETFPGIGGPPSPLLNSAASGTLQGTSVPNGLAEVNAITVPTQTGIGITGAASFSAGPPIPPFDPSLTGSLQWEHQDTPQTSTVTSGTPSLITNSYTGDLGLEKGFSTGTLVDLTFNATRQNVNSPSYLLNPNTSSSLALNVTQPLLRGFGIGMNRRFIRIAKNNEKTMDLVFKQQAIATVSGVIQLYDDLVSLIADVKVKEETLALAQRLYEDDHVQVEQGTLAPVELTRAQAGVAAARQDLANSRGYELQQELILKTVLTKRGTADQAIRDARLIPTTPIETPEKEPVRNVDDLLAEAFRNRPELEEARLQIRNSHISLEGSRNELLPELDLVGLVENSALTGQLNPLAAPPATTSGTSSTAGSTGSPEQSSIGGLGTGLSQIFSGRYPTYEIGLQLTLPLRNRVAQADVERDEMQLRQFQVQYQQLENQIRLAVEGAVIALNQARTAYDAAVETRTLQEESLKIELERFATGLSTNFLVMEYQSFVAQARSTEVAARDVYVKAQTALERALGLTLENHNISMDAVYGGRVPQAPSSVPINPPQNR
jgi:outer membrane protein